ncbi:MAG: hypothetical protein WC373_04680 [Smithella sp.]|jgi:hypothetical protein
MKTIGSQKRYTLAESGMEFVLKMPGNAALLRDKLTGRLEIWQLNDHHSGYVIEINGKGYEFVGGYTDKKE